MAIDTGRAPMRQRAEVGRWPLVGRAKEVAHLKEAISDRHGAVVTGPAGVGKTALAMVGVEHAKDQGMSVATVAGTESARAFPFGAFASQLPYGSGPAGLGSESHADLLRYYTRDLLNDAGGRPLLVFVDDAHLLDDGSAMLVHQLAQTGSATVVACVLASGRAAGAGAVGGGGLGGIGGIGGLGLGAAPTASDAMVVLWKDYSAERIELGALDEQAMEDLLVAVLGGPVDTSSMRQVAERSLGDPLFLRELVDGALESGVLADENGVWRLRGPLRPTARLVELVTLRLGILTEAERHVLELTAVGEPLAQPALDELADSAAVESLEDRGLITSRMDGRRLQVCLAHPVFGDVVRSGISARRERALARALADASGGRRQEDTLLMASLRLVGGGGSAELLLAGAQAARERRDFALTERMARAAIDNGAGFEARILAAEAAHVRGRREQAGTELAALALDAASVTEQVRVALIRFDHEFWGTGTADVTTVERLLGLGEEVDPVWRDELLARRLVLSGLVNGPRAVTDAVALPPLDRGQPPVPRTSLHAVVGECLSRTGKLEQALALLTPASTEAGVGGGVGSGPGLGGPGPVPLPLPGVDTNGGVRAEPWTPFGNHTLALVALGRLDEADQVLAAAHDDLAANPGTLENAIVAASLAGLRLEQGRVQSSFLQATSASALFLELGLPVAARWCYAQSAMALALAGVAAKATETLAELDALGLPTDMEFEVEVLQARAWAWAASGDMVHRPQEPGGGGRPGPAGGRPARRHQGAARAGPPGPGPPGGRAAAGAGPAGGRRADGDPPGLHAGGGGQGQRSAAGGGRALRGGRCAAVRGRGPGRVRRALPPGRPDPGCGGGPAEGGPAAGPLRGRGDAVRAGHRRPGPADAGRARHRPAGGLGQHGQADRRDDAPVRAHGREPAAPGLPEARSVPSARAGRRSEGPPRGLTPMPGGLAAAPLPPGSPRQTDPDRQPPILRKHSRCGTLCPTLV